jgi:hypothetical protein
MKKKEIRLNDFIEVDVHKPNYGKFPIGRADDGRICKFILPDDIKFLEYGSTYLCEVMIVENKSLTVYVHDLCRTAHQNQLLADKAIDNLKSMIESKKKEKHIMPKKGQYTSKWNR